MSVAELTRRDRRLLLIDRATELTTREVEVLQDYADGMTAVESGAKRFLSHETVKSYRKAATAKLEARSGTHAVAIALRNGFIE